MEAATKGKRETNRGAEGGSREMGRKDEEERRRIHGCKESERGGFESRERNNKKEKEK